MGGFNDSFKIGSRSYRRAFGDFFFKRAAYGETPKLQDACGELCNPTCKCTSASCSSFGRTNQAMQHWSDISVNALQVRSGSISAMKHGIYASQCVCTFVITPICIMRYFVARRK